MRLKSKRYLKFVGAIAFALGFLFYIQNQSSQSLSSLLLSPSALPPQELAIKQLATSPLSQESVWDQEFLAHEVVIKEKLALFEKGGLCKSLKTLDNKNLPHKQLISQLKELGFTCIERPLSLNSFESPLRYLKIDNTTTQNPNDKGVAYQEICQDLSQPECVIRIKRDGFPLNKRQAPHSSKAVLIDERGDPRDFNNEAFKITAYGRSLPKGPSDKAGLRKCPYHNDERSCNRWIDAIMEEAHPPLKEPVRTK